MWPTPAVFCYWPTCDATRVSGVCPITKTPAHSRKASWPNSEESPDPKLGNFIWQTWSLTVYFGGISCVAEFCHTSSSLRMSPRTASPTQELNCSSYFWAVPPWAISDERVFVVRLVTKCWVTVGHKFWLCRLRALNKKGEGQEPHAWARGYGTGFTQLCSII